MWKLKEELEEIYENMVLTRHYDNLGTTREEVGYRRLRELYKESIDEFNYCLKVEDYITSYEMVEDAENDHNVITTKIGKKDWEIIDTEKQLGRIWINKSKYFDNVPLTAWEYPNEVEGLL